MADSEWTARAVAHVGAFIDIHPDDARQLVEDLRRSWPALGPEDAVSCFFRPLQPRSGATELG
jgi:hypothetical protein